MLEDLCKLHVQQISIKLRKETLAWLANDIHRGYAGTLLP